MATNKLPPTDLKSQPHTALHCLCQMPSNIYQQNLSQNKDYNFSSPPLTIQFPQQHLLHRLNNHYQYVSSSRQSTSTQVCLDT